MTAAAWFGLVPCGLHSPRVALAEGAPVLGGASLQWEEASFLALASVVARDPRFLAGGVPGFVRPDGRRADALSSSSEGPIVANRARFDAYSRIFSEEVYPPVSAP